MASIALFVYCFLLIRFLITLSNFISKPYLAKSPQTYSDLVSILVPARNEALNISFLLESIQKQEYTSYELIVLNDDSSDETASIISSFAASNLRCKLISGKPLPAGWLGKNWACHQLAAQATGRYLLFVDADVQLRPGFIAAALHEMKSKKMSLLSVFNDQILVSAGEKSIVPLMHWILLTLLPLRLVFSVKNHYVAAASGQCMVFDARTYHTYQFHQLAKLEVVEDIYIMQQVKKAGLTCAACLANGLIRCRMYHNYREGLSGFSKNLMAGFGNSAWLTTFFVLSVTVGYFSFFSPALLTFFNGPYRLYLFYGSMVFFIISMRIMISLLSNQNIFTNLLFHPVQMATLNILLVVSVYKRITRSNQWKGRLISTK